MILQAPCSPPTLKGSLSTVLLQEQPSCLVRTDSTCLERIILQEIGLGVPKAVVDLSIEDEDRGLRPCPGAPIERRTTKENLGQSQQQNQERGLPLLREKSGQLLLCVEQSPFPRVLILKEGLLSRLKRCHSSRRHRAQLRMPHLPHGEGEL